MGRTSDTFQPVASRLGARQSMRFRTCNQLLFEMKMTPPLTMRITNHELKLMAVHLSTSASASPAVENRADYEDESNASSQWTQAAQYIPET